MSQAHEQWFHFTKEPKYFAAVDEVREPNVREPRPSELAGTARNKYAESSLTDAGPSLALGQFNPLGKLPGSVWNLTYWECVDRIERGWAPKDNPVILLEPPPLSVAI